MSWGRGWGLPWGGELVEIPQPEPAIGGLPITFDLTDEPVGPLPGLWEFYRLQNTPGTIAVQTEPKPDLFYRVTAEGVGFWVYTRNPLGGPTFREQGVAASPSGVLVGRNARAAVILRSPTELVDINADSFFFEVGLGLRFETDHSFVGGQARAQWAGGVWTEPVALEAIQAVGQAPVVLASATIEADPDPVDIWRVSDRMELEVILRGTALEVRLNGVLTTTATVPAEGPAKVVLFIRAFNKFGALISPVPTLLALQLQALRDLERLGPIPQLLGTVDHEAPQIESTKYLPVAEWLELGFLKRRGSRQFEAVLDFDAEVLEVKLGLRVGDVIRAVEPYKGQLLTASVVDLAAARGRGR